MFVQCSALESRRLTPDVPFCLVKRDSTSINRLGEMFKIGFGLMVELEDERLLDGTVAEYKALVLRGEMDEQEALDNPEALWDAMATYYRDEEC